ncbi:unnamed protein product, partial [Rotaria socialis]
MNIAIFLRQLKCLKNKLSSMFCLSLKFWQIVAYTFNEMM